MCKRFYKRASVCLLVVLPLVFFGMGCSPTLRMGGEEVDQHVVACKTCHEGKAEAGNPSLKYPENPSKTCKGCHIEANAGIHHPSSTVPGPFGSTGEIDSGFRLYDGKMECLTCHQIHSAADYLRGTKYFLAGGPYGDRRDICFRCHNWEEYKKTNPHKSMIYDGYKLDYGTCLICHATPPDPEVDREGDVKFRASIPFLCWRCHQPMGGPLFKEHFLKKPSKKTFGAMRLSKKRHDKLIPLDYKGRLTCSSCHNPHQPGVMVDGKAKEGAGKRGRQRFGIQGTTNFCGTCHTSGIGW